MRFALILAWIAGLAAAAERDPSEVMKRVRANVAASTRRVPNYTCVQTVNRDYYEPVDASLPRACSVVLEQRRHPTPDRVLRLVGTDRLRLDVTMANHGEIYSWVGASKFVDGPIDAVVRNGPIATGSFAGFLVAIFQQDVNKFTFERNLVFNGKGAMEYSFSVSQPDSHYKVKLNNGWVFTAYGGTFVVDADRDDVIRITVDTAELPRATGTCQTSITLDFQKVQIGAGSFLLPKRSLQRFVGLYGQETENTTTFANCREYRGESTLTFVEEAPPVAAKGQRKKNSSEPYAIPRGSTFNFELTSAIPTDTAAAGDTFTGKLVTPLRDSSRKVLAPAGTLLEGRLMRVQNMRVPTARSVIAFRPEALEIKGAKVAITAAPDWARSIAEQKGQLKHRFEILLPMPGEEFSGVFEFPGEHVMVAKGFRSAWRTAGPPTLKKNDPGAGNGTTFR